MAATRIIHEDAEIQVLARPGSSAFTLVTFAGLTDRPGNDFFWGRTAVEKLDLDCIGIVPWRENWYPVESMARAAAAIAAAAKPLRIGYGFSMGGYGVLKHGRRLGLTHALALSPQATIDPTEICTSIGWHLHYQPALHAKMRVVAADLAPWAAVLADPWDGDDGPHMQALSALPVQRVVAPFLGHWTPHFLSRTDVLRRMLDLVLAQDAPGLRRVLRAQRRNSALWSRRLAVAARERGHHALADRLWQDALVRGFRQSWAARDDALAEFARCRRLRAAGRLEEAAQALERGLLRIPRDDVDFLLQAAGVLMTQREPEAAISLYEAAVALKEDSVALHGLSHALTTAGRGEEALDPARRAVAAAPPGNAAALAWLGQLLAHLGRPAEAIPALRAALERDATLAATHRTLIHALVANGQPDEARVWLKIARMACPGEPLLEELAQRLRSPAVVVAALRPAARRSWVRILMRWRSWRRSQA